MDFSWIPELAEKTGPVWLVVIVFIAVLGGAIFALYKTTLFFIRSMENTATSIVKTHDTRLEEMTAVYQRELKAQREIEETRRLADEARREKKDREFLDAIKEIRCQYQPENPRRRVS